MPCCRHWPRLESTLRLVALPEWIGGIVVAAAAAEKHESHKPATDQERKERTEPEGDPPVLVHHVLAGIPDECRPHDRENQHGEQHGQQDVLPYAEFLPHHLASAEFTERTDP